jgi:hypothetical protein
MGSWRMSTDEVSRWIRSCSMPMRTGQNGLSHPIGSVSGISRMRSSTTCRTRSR